MAADESARLEYASRIPAGLVLLGAVFPLTQVATAFLLDGPAGMRTWDVQPSARLTIASAFPAVVGGGFLYTSPLPRD
jgi:hypothetical protein